MLKWVAVVFLAGFIGYFGKHLGRILIARFNSKKKRDTVIPWSEKGSSKKIKKKRLKQIQKIEKKSQKKINS